MNVLARIDHHTAYALAPESAHLTSDTETEYRFRILQPDGTPLTSFAEAHQKKIHLIVVRRDLTGFWHVHPTEVDDRVGEGVWAVALRLGEPGEYRVFADFSPAGLGQSFTVSADLWVDGGHDGDGEFRDLPAPATTYTIDDYEIELDGELIPGEASGLTFSVRRNGKPVTDLRPYLAAYGHLVAIRAEDLAYVHVHPDGSPGDGVTAPGPEIAFQAHVPEPGAYRLFLDFQHGDTVRTARFTVVAN